MEAIFSPDELSIRLGSKCKVCKARAVYSIYSEERLPIQWGGGNQVGYFLNYCLDYAVCEEHKHWVKPVHG